MAKEEETIEFVAGVSSEEHKLEMKWRTFLMMLFMIALGIDLAAIAYFIEAIRWW